MDLSITTERDGDVCRISVQGEIDVYTSAALKDAIIGAIEQGCINLIVDIDAVGFIDSSGLGVLVSGLRRVKENSGSMRVVCTKQNVLKIFRITGLDRVFPVFSSAEEASGF
ncbi:MAG: STAS domain-containing protein [Actinomycetota bacterium]|nr:MAG: anti-sigma B factor [Actinomycetota bacterium]MDO8950841.1 STAS domain-containing protein [Actinomycetota bacterium]MDP3629718.1 STAS domain-containing protein [Actinomycetota bacterium]